MKPPAFEYHAPTEIEEALDLLSRHGEEAKVLAGGQSLVPAMNFRLAAPAVLVDLNRVSSLTYLRDEQGEAVIGAMTRQRAVERSDLIRRRCPLVHEAMPWIAHPQIRNRGTFGGSVAHADPASELPAVLLALGATLIVKGRDGSRAVPAEDFFIGLFETALQPGEILTEVRLPPTQSHWGFAFLEMARRHGDYALAGVATAVRLDGEGRCVEARVALFSVADTPLLSSSARSVLVGARGRAEEIAEAARGAARVDIEPAGDIHASADYRRHLVDVLTRRALARAFERARAASV